jgi:hypothetical protein
MKSLRYVVLLAVLLMLWACAAKAPVEPQQPAQPNEPEKPLPTCFDGIQNQGEDKADCGGPCKLCPSCFDQIQNQGEAGKDCGGPCKDTCPTCFDGIKNQGEVEVDCGGPCNPCEINYIVTAEDKTMLEAKLKPNIKGMFLTNSYPTGLLIGESHVFVLGITNTYEPTYDFMVKLKFKEARDARNNIIDGVDPATVLAWFDDNEWQAAYNLKQYDQAFIPVGLTVGEKMGQKQTAPGTYYFEMEITYQRSKISTEEHDTLPFNLKVK